MLDDQQRQVELFLDPAQQPPERLGLPLGDARGRLVEQEQGGLQRQQARDLGDAARASGQLLDLLVAVGVQAHGADQLARDPVLVALVSTEAEHGLEVARGCDAFE